MNLQTDGMKNAENKHGAAGGNVPPPSRKLMRSFIILTNSHFFPAKGTDIAQIKPQHNIFHFYRAARLGQEWRSSFVCGKTKADHGVELCWASGPDPEDQIGRTSKKENRSWRREPILISDNNLL